MNAQSDTFEYIYFHNSPREKCFYVCQLMDACEVKSSAFLIHGSLSFLWHPCWSLRWMRGGDGIKWSPRSRETRISYHIWQAFHLHHFHSIIFSWHVTENFFWQYGGRARQTFICCFFVPKSLRMIHHVCKQRTNRKFPSDSFKYTLDPFKMQIWICWLSF